MLEPSLSPMTSALSLALLHFVWQGFVLGIAGWLILNAMSRAPAVNRYWVSLVLFVAMACCPVITFNLTTQRTARRTTAT